MKRRRAFTLIEILVVIGIILVLIAIVFTALKYTGGATKTAATRVDLQNLQSMLAELENAGPLTTTIQFPATPPFPTGYNVNSMLGGIGDVSEAAYSAGNGSINTDRWLNPGICTTQFVTGRLRSIPSNRQSMSSLPTERFVKAQGDGPAYGSAAPNSTTPIRTLNGAHGTPDPPIMADAWGNPIIFVPTQGLNCPGTFDGSPAAFKKGVVMSDGTKYYRCVKNGATEAGKADPSFWEILPGQYAPVVVAPGHRPFFASAGPDGDFRSPDDNVYSFGE